MMFNGGGNKNIRNAIGKIRALKVVKLNIINIIPEMNIGNDAMWNSTGRNVYDPYHFIEYASVQRITPIISLIKNGPK